MTKWFIYLNLAYFIIIINQSLAKIVFKIHIFNYKNINDLLYNGGKCENLYWAGDYCDPIFKICVTSSKNCDIINTQTKVSNNQKVIFNVFSKDIYLNSFQKSISVDVTVDDSDSYKLENIAKFTANFQLEKVPYSLSKKMQVLSQNKNVFLQASIRINCFVGFTGDLCEYNIDEYQCIKRCINGKCKFNQKNGNYKCFCHLNWKGYNCDSFINPTTLSSVLLKTLSSKPPMETTKGTTFPYSLSHFISISGKDKKISINSTNSFYTSKSIILNSFSTSKFASLPSLTSTVSIKSLFKSTKQNIERNLSKLDVYSTKSSNQNHKSKLLSSTENNRKKILNQYRFISKPPIKTKFYSETTKTSYTSNFFQNNKNRFKKTNSKTTTDNSYSNLINQNNTNLNIFKTKSFTGSLTSDFVKKISVIQTKISYSNTTNISTRNKIIIQERSTRPSKFNKFDYNFHNLSRSIPWNKTNKHYSDIYTDSSFKSDLSKSTNRKFSEFRLTTKSKDYFHKTIKENSSTYRPVNIQVPFTKSLLFNLYSKNTKVVLLRNLNLRKSTRLNKRHSAVYSDEILNSSKNQVTTAQKTKLSKSSLFRENVTTVKAIFSTTSSSKYKIETEIQIVTQKRVENKNEKSPSISEKLTLVLQTVPKVIFVCFSAWLLMIILLIIIIFLKVKKRKQIRKKKSSNKSIKSSSKKDNCSVKLNKKENLTVKSLKNKSFSKYESILLNLDNENREII